MPSPITRRPRKLHHILVSREFGGAAQIATNISESYFTERKLDSVFWLPGAGRAWESISSKGFDICQFDSCGLRSTTGTRSAISNYRLGLQLKKHAPCSITVHCPFIFASMRIALKLSRSPVIVYVHLDFGSDALKWAFRYPPDAIVTCADYLQDQVLSSIRAKDLRSTIVTSINNGVDTISYHPSLRQKKRSSGNPVDSILNVLMLANLSPHKGQETAIRAAATLKSWGVKFRLLLAGIDRSDDKAYEHFLKNLVVDLNISEQVQFLGFRADTAELLQSADILLLPSTREGLPLSILEAQATGIPVIASPHPGVTQIVQHGVNGFLAESSDSESYAQYIQELTNNHCLYNSMSEVSRENISKLFSWDASWRKIKHLHDTLHNHSCL